MIPPSVTRTVVGFEMAAAKAWADRRGWRLELDGAGLRLTAWTIHPKDGKALQLAADLRGYRALPPAWEFLDPQTGTAATHASPKGEPVEVAPGEKRSSIFIQYGNRPHICAPFNRLSYKDANGPHGGENDWGDAHNWLDVIAYAPQDIVRASTLGEMLDTIDLHLRASPGRWA
jgi:hypothetical protein